MQLIRLTCIVLFVMGVGVARADIPSVMNYQGKLTDNGGVPVPDATYEVAFAIYQDSTGGSSLWSETHMVETVDGLFGVLLGTINPLGESVFNGTPRYLGIQVGEDPEISPRTRLASVPYAFQAGNTSAGGPTPHTDWLAPLWVAVDGDPDGAVTLITVYNADDVDNRITVAFYDEDGVLLDQCIETIAPAGLMIVQTNGINGCPIIPVGSGYVRVSGQGPVAPTGLVAVAGGIASFTGDPYSASLIFYRM